MGIELSGVSCLCAVRACIYIGLTSYRIGWAADQRWQAKASWGRFEPLTEYLGLFRSGMLVDVFFLRVVDAHKALYRLDDALCVAD